MNSPNKTDILGVLGLMAVAVAFMVVRGTIGGARPFLDGYTPPPPYRWVSPPPALAAANQPPTGGAVDIPLTDGASEAAGAFTDDGQVTVSFNPGTFTATGAQTAVHVRIIPVTPQPVAPAGIIADGNVYSIEAMLMPSGKPAVPLRAPVLVDMRYPQHKPDAIYRIEGKSWTPIDSTVQDLLLTIDARSTQLGTFAAGHQATSAAAPQAGWNPWLVAALAFLAMLGVALLAGVRIRRRR